MRARARVCAAVLCAILSTALSTALCVRSECARLQGFPDSYVLSGQGVPESVQYSAVGNAVAPPVITAIARVTMAVVGRAITLVD